MTVQKNSNYLKQKHFVIEVITVTFGLFNTSLLNKSIHFSTKNQYTGHKPLNDSVYIMQGFFSDFFHRLYLGADWPFGI